MLEKNRKLGETLCEMRRVLVAFSGGVDSTFLLKRAHQELGSDNVLAVVVASELFRKEEFEGAVNLAKQMNIPVLETEIHELEDDAIVANTPDSWYFSKKMLYNHLNELAKQRGFHYVLDGMIMDDLDDFRPGLRARTEAGVRSVLQEADLYKREIRILAKELEVPVWDKPASCSLASRIPYGTIITKQKIDQVNKAEQFIQTLGFSVVRVRHHGDVARIEALPEDIEALLACKEKIGHKLQSLGFAYVSVDLFGYRVGSMNEVLDEKQQHSEVS